MTTLTRSLPRTTSSTDRSRSADPRIPDAARRVLIVALGTRGDVEPAVRLGSVLSQRGDRVLVATFADGVARVERAGLRALGAGPSSAEAMRWRSPAAQRFALRHPGAMYLQTRTSLARQAGTAAAALAPAVAGADLVLCGLASAGLVPVLQRAGIRSRLMLHAPLLPHVRGTSTWANGFGRLLPPGMESARQDLMWGLTRGMSSALARELAGAVPRAAPALATHPDDDLAPPLLSTSPVLDPQPSPDLHQTGWWADPSPVDPLPAWVEDWLVRHPDPVLLSLGSLAQHDPRGEVERLAAVARRAGAAALVQVRGAAPERSGPVLLIPEVDHRALLPRVAAVVHHGGSGTTHAVAAAGRPQLVVPHLGDQAHYGRQVHRSGLGPPPLPATRASVPGLARGLTDLMAEPAYSRAATAAAAELTDEDGLGQAVAALGSLRAKRAAG